MDLNTLNQKINALLLKEEEYKQVATEIKNNLAKLRKNLKQLKSRRYELTRVGEGEPRICTCCKNTYPATSQYFPMKRKYKSGKIGFRGRCNKCYYQYLKDKGILTKRKPYTRNYRKDFDKKSRENLEDRYIKSLIYQSHSIPYTLITPEVIEEKRNIIKLKRAINEKTRTI